VTARFTSPLVYFPRSDLALDLHVGAFGKRSREVSTSAPNNAAMPRRFRLVFAGFAVLPAPLCREGQECKGRLVPGVTKLSVFAEEIPWPRAAAAEHENAAE
jgi:hypothetical protein